MSKYYYVVMQRGEEYDDEYYSLNEGGSPERIFKDKKVAQACANEMNAARMSGVNLADYYESQCYFTSPEEIIQEMFPDHKWDEERQNLPEMTTAQYVLLRPYLPFQFYYVREVEGEDS